MGQPDSLRHVFGRSTPYQCVLEALLQTTMDRIADVFDCRVVANDECLAKVRVNSLSVWLLEQGVIVGAQVTQ
jgi:hypothetical protein